MILIADIGATKGEWRLVKGMQISQYESKGFNPSSQELTDFAKTVPVEFRDYSFEKVYLYGAGFTGDWVQEIQKAASEAFPNARVEVYSDLFGAARSLFGQESGIACILGTGSAACHYDGRKVSQRIPSLGYLLGDEASGYFYGKSILVKYLRGHLSESLSTSFEKKYGKLSEQQVLKEVYEGNPKPYISQFAEFVIENQSDPYLYRMIYEGIELFFRSYFRDLPGIQGVRIRFVGSVAYFLTNILKKVARDHDLTVDLIAQKPIAGLTLYHQEHG